MSRDRCRTLSTTINDYIGNRLLSSAVLSASGFRNSSGIGTSVGGNVLGGRRGESRGRGRESRWRIVRENARIEKGEREEGCSLGDHPLKRKIRKRNFIFRYLMVTIFDFLIYQFIILMECVNH